MAQSVTLSSVGTATLVLNPLAKSTSVLLSASIASTGSAVQIEMSLDDQIMPGGSSATWALLSSATAMVGSTNVPLSAVYTVLSPIGAVRLNSTGIIASSAVFVLKALQSITA